MARMARVVVPNYPHHITQRDNRRQKTFFTDDDYQAYISLLTNAKEPSGVGIWAYCLMPNHVHLVVVPEYKDSLAVFFVKLIVNTRGALISGKAGVVIFGKSDSIPL